MRDEVILALDLYFRGDRNPSMDACTELSSILRSIPVEKELAADPAFRGPNSVRSKTQNFLGMDPGTDKVGRSNASGLDHEVWDEFAADPIRLAATAEAIRANIGFLDQSEAEAEEEEVTEAEEGAILTRVHRGRERNVRLRKTKIKRVRDETGRLACEACDLDFGERYGERGDGFIECHHSKAVSDLRPGERTKIEDLVLLCPNCHRMVHLKRPWLTLDELIAIQGQAAG